MELVVDTCQLSAWVVVAAVSASRGLEAVLRSETSARRSVVAGSRHGQREGCQRGDEQKDCANHSGDLGESLCLCLWVGMSDGRGSKHAVLFVVSVG